MQRKDKVISASDKIKYYEGLAVGGCYENQKFSSKAYRPTPYNSLKTPASVAKHISEFLESRADIIVDKYDKKTLERTAYSVPNNETQDVKGTDINSKPNHKVPHVNRTEVDTVTGRQAESINRTEADTVTVRLDESINRTEADTVTVQLDESIKETDVDAVTVPLAENMKGTDAESKAEPMAHYVERKSAQIDASMMANNSPSGSIASDSTEILHVEKIYEEHLEQKKKFEAQTEKLSREMEMRIREMCDCLDSIRVETEEIERIVQFFADTVTALSNIKYKADRVKISEIKPDETTSKTLVKEHSKIEQEVHGWLNQIDEIRKKRVVSLRDLYDDLWEMNNFVRLLKQKTDKYSVERIKCTEKDKICKDASFVTEGNQLQTFETGVLKMKSLQNKTPDNVNIKEGFNQNLTSKRRGECYEQSEGSASTLNTGILKNIELSQGNIKEGRADTKRINASLDLALSSSFKSKEDFLRSPKKLEKYRKTPDIVRQRSVDELASSSIIEERKSKIPKPTWHRNVSSDRKRPDIPLDSSESGDHIKTADVENQILKITKEETEWQVLNESNRTKGRENEKRNPSLPLKYENARGKAVIIDNKTKATKNLKDGSFRLKMKEIGPKINTGLKTRSEDLTKGMIKTISHLVSKQEEPETKLKKDNA